MKNLLAKFGIVGKNSLKSVEIEIFSYCNRRCWFCPNNFIDRHSENILMDESMYINILKNLQLINYQNKISYSRYNEPTSHKDIFLKRLNQARKYLPEAYLHTNTNGDYLNNEYIKELANAGLNSLYIQQYLNINEEFDNEKLKEKIIQKAQMLELEYELVNNIENEYVQFNFIFKNLDIKMYARNFKVTGNNRGGTLAIKERSARICPCFVPFTNMYIDYNGNVMPCCNLRSDVKEHEKFILGNLKNSSLTDIYTGSSARKLRRILKSDKILIEPCNECNFALNRKLEL